MEWHRQRQIWHVLADESQTDGALSWREWIPVHSLSASSARLACHADAIPAFFRCWKCALASWSFTSRSVWFDGNWWWLWVTHRTSCGSPWHWDVAGYSGAVAQCTHEPSWQLSSHLFTAKILTRLRFSFLILSCDSISLCWVLW